MSREWKQGNFAYKIIKDEISGKLNETEFGTSLQVQREIQIAWKVINSNNPLGDLVGSNSEGVHDPKKYTAFVRIGENSPLHSMSEEQITDELRKRNVTVIMLTASKPILTNSAKRRIEEYGASMSDVASSQHIPNTNLYSVSIVAEKGKEKEAIVSQFPEGTDFKGKVSSVDGIKFQLDESFQHLGETISTEIQPNESVFGDFTF